MLVCNTEALAPEDVPRSIFELTEPRWRGAVALANPLFGATATHAAALFAALGEAQARRFFTQLQANGVAVVAGNATVKDRVAAGAFAVGFTDTDDVFVALERGLPVVPVYPDQDGLGTLLIPNTVALIRGAPEAGKRLIDFILSEEVEERLAFAKGGQIPLRSSVPRPERLPRLEELRLLDVDYEDLADQLETSSTFLRDLFLGRSPAASLPASSDLKRPADPQDRQCRSHLPVSDQPAHAVEGLPLRQRREFFDSGHVLRIERAKSLYLGVDRNLCIWVLTDLLGSTIMVSGVDISLTAIR